MSFLIKIEKLDKFKIGNWKIEKSSNSCNFNTIEKNSAVSNQFMRIAVKVITKLTPYFNIVAPYRQATVRNVNNLGPEKSEIH